MDCFSYLSQDLPGLCLQIYSEESLSLLLLSFSVTEIINAWSMVQKQSFSGSLMKGWYIYSQLVKALNKVVVQ